MISGAASRLGAEIGDAGRSMLRLLRFDPLWAERIDLSTDGFLRSFWAPLLALPLNLLVVHFWSRAQAGGPSASLFGNAVAHLFDAAAYPLVLAALAKPTGIDAGYAAFVTLANWAGLFLNVALAVAALPLLVIGSAGSLFSVVALALTAAYIFALWRSGRETLGGGGIGPVMMVVVLSVGVGAVADQVGAWLS